MVLKLSINVSVKLAYVFCLGTFKNIYTLLYIYRCTGILLNNTLSGRKQLALFVFPPLFFHWLGEGVTVVWGKKSRQHYSSNARALSQKHIGVFLCTLICTLLGFVLF